MTTRPTFCELGCAAGTDKCGKGHGYHPWYETHFGPLRDEPVRILEIGVQKGASLRVWEQYFPKAEIFGVDIDPACRGLASPRSKVFIGDQQDPAFLAGLAKELGELDILVDDGGHHMGPQQASFRALFPIIKPGGFYVIEDLETCYLPSFGGGAPGHPGTTMAFLKSLLEDVQWKYHTERSAPCRVSAVHLYDAIAFLVRGKD